MIKIIAGIFLLFSFMCCGCGETGKNIKPESSYDHKHFYTNPQTIDDIRHGHMVVNHLKGEIYLLIFDNNEEPMKLKAKKIKAVMTLPKQEKKELTFKPEANVVKCRRGKNRLLTNTYFIQEEWIKEVHDFEITFHVPIKGKIYKPSFTYKALHDHKECGDNCPPY